MSIRGAGRLDATSSVAPISVGSGRSLRPCLVLSAIRSATGSRPDARCHRPLRRPGLAGERGAHGRLDPPRRRLRGDRRGAHRARVRAHGRDGRVLRRVRGLLRRRAGSPGDPDRGPPRARPQPRRAAARRGDRRVRDRDRARRRPAPPPRRACGRPVRGPAHGRRVGRRAGGGGGRAPVDGPGRGRPPLRRRRGERSRRARRLRDGRVRLCGGQRGGARGDARAGRAGRDHRGRVGDDAERDDRARRAAGRARLARACDTHAAHCRPADGTALSSRGSVSSRPRRRSRSRSSSCTSSASPSPAGSVRARSRASAMRTWPPRASSP